MSDIEDLKVQMIVGGMSATRAEEVALRVAALPAGQCHEALFTKEQLAAPPKRVEMYDFVTTLTEEIANFVRKRFTGVDERFAAIENRFTEIEQRGVKYAGVHQRALNYPQGSIVTYEGQGWVALRAVEPGEEPGSSKAWQLFIQKGRNGKDAR